MAKKEVTPTQKALNLWAIVVIVWSIYRAKFQTLLPLWFDELFMKPLVFIAPIAYYIIISEGKNFFKGIWFTTKSWKTDVAMGVGIGGLLFAVGLVSRSLRTGSFAFNTTQEHMLLFMVIMLATAISEEIISRGFVLKRLYEESKNMFTASFFGSILYFFLKVPILFTNERIAGNMLLQIMFIDILFSLAISMLYLMRRSLLLVIIIHAFYNFTILALM